VGGYSSGDAVRLPDIHFSTASAVVANTGVLVVVRGDPALNIALRRID
jgi:hypothetical protein